MQKSAILRATAAMDTAKQALDIRDATIETLTRRVEELEGVVGECERQFRWYTELHEAKGPEHANKAARNREYADKCLAALPSDGADHG